MTKKSIFLLMAAALGPALLQSQVTVLVDFGPVASRHSVDVADANGNYWDYITGSTDNNTTLTGVDGVATSINLQMVSGFSGPGTYNGGLTPVATLGFANNGNFAFTGVTDDALFFLDSATPVMTLTGLNDSLTYDLTLYGARVTTTTRTTTYAVGASSGTLTTSGTGIASTGGNWNDDTVLTLPGLSPLSGSLTVNLSATGGFGYINAMQITAVPEPATFALLAGFATLGLVLYRRRLVD